MKKLLFVFLVMSVCCSNASEKTITAITRSAKDAKRQIRYKYINTKPDYVRLPLIIGNKTFYQEDLERYSDRQRDLLYEVSHPSRCLRFQGVTETVLREHDVQRLQQEIPSIFSKEFNVFVLKTTSMPTCTNNPCLCGVAGLPSAGLCLAGGCAEGVACLEANMTYSAYRIACASNPATWVGLGLMLSSLGIVGTCALIKFTQYFCCADKEWRMFDNQSISQESPDADTSPSDDSD